MAKKRYYQVRNELVNMIANQKLAGNRLPPEAVLADRLNVSRGTIREAMQTLASEGIISKKHGMGNFVHKSAIETRMRIDTIQDFRQMIEDGGYTPRMEQIGTSDEILIPDDFFEKTAQELNVKNKKELVTLQSIYHANERPAIYSQVFVPKDIILEDPKNKTRNTLFGFLKEFCNQTVDQTIICFKPEIAGELEAKVLQIQPKTPLIRWEEYYYNIFDEVICVSLTYFHPEYMHLTMLRKADEDSEG